MALDEYERSLCPCGCGLPIAESMDPHREFSVEQVVCYARRAIDIHKRRDTETAEKKNNSVGWDDGMFWVVDDTRIAEQQP